MSLNRLILQFVRTHWRPYAASAGMLICIALLTVWIPRHVGSIVDALVAHRLDGTALVQQLSWLLGAGLVIYLFRVSWRVQLFGAAFRLGVELRARLYRQLTLQGPSFFHTQRTGDLMALATNDVDAVELAAGEALLAGFDGSLTLFLVLVMMTAGVDVRLGLAALFPFPFMAIAFWRISLKVHDAWTDSLNQFSVLNQHVQENLAAVRTVRALGLVDHSRKQFQKLAEEAAESGFQAQRYEAAYEPAVGTALSAAIVIVLGLGGYLVAQGELSIGQLTSFSMYLGQLIWPMFAAGWVLSLMERGRAAWSRIAPVLDAPLTLLHHGTHPVPADTTLHLEQIRFRYPGSETLALDGIDLRLPAGQRLGIVGATGSGKSTLLRLLLRQYEPEAGTITMGGIPLPEIQIEGLRETMAWVPQEPFLFSASIQENIALSRPDARPDEIEAAARLAAVHEDISRLPQGYATLVGERGVTLSGGQRQRIAIARALLTSAPLLLLDDALSAVDTGTETQILEHLRTQQKKRTMIILSHRLSAVMDAEEIIVLRKGMILERGTHASLLASGGWYANQWRYQQLEATLHAH